MNEVLKPYSDFGASDLAHQLNEAVEASYKLLEARDLLGPVACYGTYLEVAEANVKKGQHEAKPRHFAVVSDSGDVVGAASINDNLDLRKLHLPVPVAVARGPLMTNYPYAKPNLAAWTIPEAEEALARAYLELVDMTKPAPNSYAGRSALYRVVEPKTEPWALEPARSPRFVHEAIAQAGLIKVATRRYDAGESSRRIPRRGTLYAYQTSGWLTSLGRHRELRTGAKKWITV